MEVKKETMLIVVPVFTKPLLTRTVPIIGTAMTKREIIVTTTLSLPQDVEVPNSQRNSDTPPMQAQTIAITETALMRSLCAIANSCSALRYGGNCPAFPRKLRQPPLAGKPWSRPA